MEELIRDIKEILRNELNSWRGIEDPALKRIQELIERNEKRLRGNNGRID